MNRREVPTERITKEISRLVQSAAYVLSDDVKIKLAELQELEKESSAKEIMNIILENSVIAEEDSIPLCQDCGSALIFLEIGQDIILTGEPLEDTVNRGVAEAYEEAYLRKSIVADPLRRNNTGTNTPAFIHVEIVKGDKVKITVCLKGGGSENMTALKMFRPTDSVEKIIDYISDTVIDAGPNPCPPLFLGIGIGGSADIALLNAKKAVLRGAGVGHADPFYNELEKKIKLRLNETNVGPLGFGGHGTVAGVYIMEAPAHIATLPVALNLNCHSLRYRSVVI